jgi:hypothetical protein
MSLWQQFWLNTKYHHETLKIFHCTRVGEEERAAVKISIAEL